MASVTWTCPSCNRRVPNRVATCHCGTKREQAERRVSRPGARAAAAPPGWDITALAIVLVLVTAAGLVWLFVPHRPERVYPVLGFVDNLPSPPPPPRAPRPPAPAPPFKLPWWK